MKSYILFFGLVVAIAQVQSTILEEALQTEEKCRAESKFSSQDVLELLNLQVSQPAKCYVKCFLKSEGFWQDKKLNKKLALDILNKFQPTEKFRDVVTKVLDQCQDVKADDECEAAFAAVKCVTIAGLKTVGEVVGKLLFVG